MSSGLTVYNGATTQFTTKSPALLVDRTAKYGYKNYQLTFSADPTQPPAPTGSTLGAIGSIYIPLFQIYHGLGRIPAFETVSIGYGLPPGPWGGGAAMANEDFLLSQGSPTGTYEYTNEVWNQLIFRPDMQYLYVGLYRTSVNDYDFGSGTSFVSYPFSLSGVQININVQIFAMGLNDSLSQV